MFIKLIFTFYFFNVLFTIRDSVHCLAVSRSITTSTTNLSTQKKTSIDATTDTLLTYETSAFKSKVTNKVGKLNILSKVTFSWIKKLMINGKNRSIDMNELYFPENNELSKVSPIFDTYFNYEKEVIRNTTTLSSSSSTTTTYTMPIDNKNILKSFWASPVTKATMKMYRKDFLHTGILKFFNTLTQFTPSLLISRILHVAEKSNTANPLELQSLQHQGLIYATLLLFALCTKTLFENQYFDQVINMSAKIRTTLSAAIYKKSLQLTPSSRQNNTAGQIVNFMQLDTARMEYVAGSIHTVWDGVLQVIGYTCLLLHFLGPSVLAGIAVMLFIIPLNAFFLDKLSEHKSELSKKTDSRVKLTNEVLQGIRAIKSYNWEKPFAIMLSTIRKQELKALKKSANVRAILVSLLSAAPSFVAVITLAVYTLLGNKLTPTKVFTALALFNQLRFPLIFFPMLLNALADGKVSLIRLTNFLMAKEIERYVEYNVNEEQYLNSAIVITNTTFTWGNTIPISSTTTTSNSNSNSAAINGVSLIHTSSESTSVMSTNTSHMNQSHIINTTPVDTVDSSSTTENNNNNNMEVVGGEKRGNLNHVNIHIKKGELVAIVGPVGSGKSNLLSAILGDMNKVTGTSGRVIVNGNVAYVPQTSWIPNDTLRNVILFGRAYEENKYKQAIKVCNLEKDLELLDSGDMTEIGEKGANLSGGQKQRLSMARAVYEDADVYLFDDPLSALDAEVGNKLFNRCIKTALFNKTRILVTHQLSVLPYVDRVIIMHQNEYGEGYIKDQGSLQELLKKGYDLSKLVRDSSSTAPTVTTADYTNSTALTSDESILVSSTTEAASVTDLHVHNQLATENTLTATPTTTAATTTTAAATAVSDVNISCVTSLFDINVTTTSESSKVEDSNIHQMTTSSHNPTPVSAEMNTTIPYLASESTTNLPKKDPKKLMTIEEKAEGAVSRTIYLRYLQAAKNPLLLTIIFGSFILSNTCQILQQWIVGAWTNDINYHKYPLYIYLSAVASMASGVAFFTWVRSFMSTIFGAASSQTLHNNMVIKVLSAPLSYFESTPVGRLMQRFSKDMDQMDQQLPGSFSQLLASSLNIFGALFTISLATPTFAIIMIPILIIYIHITEFFRPIARELKRIDSISRSPIYQQFGETLSGLQVIRSYKRQALYQTKNEIILDDNFAAFYTLKIVDRWLSVRLELLGNFIVYSSAILAVIMRSKGGSAGISLSNALSITGMLNWAVRNGAETESYMNSVERILYTTDNTPSEGLALTPILPTRTTIIGSNKVLDSSATSTNIISTTTTPSTPLTSLSTLSTTPSLHHHPTTTATTTPVSTTNHIDHSQPSTTTTTTTTTTSDLTTRRQEEVGSHTATVLSSSTEVLDMPQLESIEVKSTSIIQHMSSGISNTTQLDETSLCPPVKSVSEVVTTTTTRIEKKICPPIQDPIIHMSDDELIKSGWPWQGGIVFNDVVMRYRSDFDPVLKGVSVSIHPGESIGIVGRTGSGKSTLFRVLLRLNEVEEGSVYIDGVDISKIGLDTLRSRISIIPQDAVLFSGSIRMNLDPFHQYTDEELWTALRKAHALGMIANLPGGLNFEVSEGGENFSAGQRQQLCLARALVRRSKILILDEATSSVDYETDALIQSTIREEFGHGKCTVLTIAHRLGSILDSDRILVMSKGQVGELDTPDSLLQNKESLFYKLVENDKNAMKSSSSSSSSSTSSSSVTTTTTTTLPSSSSLSSSQVPLNNIIDTTNTSNNTSILNHHNKSSVDDSNITIQPKIITASAA